MLSRVSISNILQSIVTSFSPPWYWDIPQNNSNLNAPVYKISPCWLFPSTVQTHHFTSSSLQWLDTGKYIWHGALYPAFSAWHIWFPLLWPESVTRIFLAPLCLTFIKSTISPSHQAASTLNHLHFGWNYASNLMQLPHGALFHTLLFESLTRTAGRE